MNRSSLAFLFILAASLSSCEAIEGIFKAGMWTGIIVIALIVGIVLWLIGRSRR